MGLLAPVTFRDSPVSNNGRGLKLFTERIDQLEDDDSPVSNNGRGLKRLLLPDPQLLQRFAR